MHINIVLIKSISTQVQIAATAQHDKGDCDVKQGRFACKLCSTHFYHATALVAHYEKEHEETLRKQ